MKFYNAFFGLLPLRILRIFFLNLNRKNNISFKSNIGIGIYLVDNIRVEAGGKIENLTFININKLVIGVGSTIRRFNFINGPFDVILHNKCGIGKGNKIFRSKFPIVSGYAALELLDNTFVNASHFLDLTKSIRIGSNTVLAGRKSQFWTHGYYHANTGIDRIRIDGEIFIGSNVYVGSGCIFNPGVNVSNAIHIGAGSVISKNLEKSGMYVNQPLRYIENDIDIIKSKLKRVEDISLVEDVYKKDI